MQNAFACLLFMSFIGLSAQQIISGVVRDSSGSPIPAASVVIKDTSKGVSTDFDGNYSIAVEIGEVLVVSSIGFETQEVVVSGITLNITLNESTSELDEVVIIGYGSVKRKDLTGSVEVVSSKDFNRGAIVSTDQLLQGKAAGVRITDSGGSPDSAPNIRIRGGSSLNADSSPLIVIDGVPLGAQNPAGVSNPLTLVNPNDVASFTILKDASATAIYGARASNGVIIITTKSGASGDLQYSFSSSTTFSKAGDGLDVMGSDDYVRFINEYHFTEAGKLGVEVGSIASSEASKIIETAAGPRAIYNTNWKDEILRTAYTSNTTFSVRGNLYENLPFRASLGHNKAEGVVKTDDYERLTASLKLTPSFLDDNLKVDANTKFTFADKNAADSGGALGGALVFDPTKPVYDDNGPFGGYYTNTNGNLLDGQYNPVALLHQRDRLEEVFRFLGNIELDYTMPFLPELKAVVNVGLDTSSSEISETLGEGALVGYRIDGSGNGVFNPGVNYTETQTITNTTFDAYLKYSKSYDKTLKSFDIQLGYSYQNFENDGNRGLYAYAVTIDEGDIGKRYKTFNENNPTNRYYNDQNIQSVFARSNVNIMDKYLITLSLRADASSLFVNNDVFEDGVWGLFPAAALAWKVKEEAFLRDVDFINDLKLRLGWGKTGQQNITGNVGFYPTSPLFTVGDPNSQYLPGVALYSANPFQKGLTWEKTATLNAGIDFAILESRILTGSFDVFKRETIDLLTDINLPPGQALSDKFIANKGTTESKGFELGLNVNPINSKIFSLSLNGNLFYAKTEVTDLGGVNTLPIGGGLLGTGSNLLFNKLGKEPYQAGVFKQVYDRQGNPIPNAFVDLNGDNQITQEDKYYKSIRPKWNFGFGINMTYKNFDFSASFRGQLDGSVYDLNALRLGHTESAAPNNNTSISNVLNFYNGAANPIFKDAIGNIQFSDYFLKNASFMRCENIILGYNLPDNFVKNTAMRIYAMVNNPFIITDYDGQDPENFEGIDSSFYPRPTAYTIGLNIDF